VPIVPTGALQEPANRLEGKPVSSMQLSGPEGAPLVPESEQMDKALHHVDQIVARLAEWDRQNADATTDEVDPASNEEPGA